MISEEEWERRSTLLYSMTNGKDLAALVDAVVIALYQTDSLPLESILFGYDVSPELRGWRMKTMLNRIVLACHASPVLPPLLQSAANHKICTKRRHSKARTLGELESQVQRTRQEIEQVNLLRQARKLIRLNELKREIQDYANEAGLYSPDCSAVKRSLILGNIEARFSCSFRMACDGAGVPYAAAIQYRNRKQREKALQA